MHAFFIFKSVLLEVQLFHHYMQFISKYIYLIIIMQQLLKETSKGLPISMLNLFQYFIDVYFVLGYNLSTLLIYTLS